MLVEFEGGNLIPAPAPPPANLLALDLGRGLEVHFYEMAVTGI